MTNQDLINLLTNATELKKLKRTGWIKKGVADPESVADHTWRMSLMIMLLAPQELNKSKLLEMCIVHDMGEINIGDVIWESGKEVIASKEVKHEDEVSAMKTLFGAIDTRYVDLVEEFNAQQTPEAKFLKQIDKLEMAFQALEYQKAGYEASLFDEFWENAEKYLMGQSLEEIFVELKKLRD